jgi:hypothetical protein
VKNSFIFKILLKLLQSYQYLPHAGKMLNL